MSANTQITILCASARLAHGLRVRHQKQQTQSGTQTWQAPTITTLTDWLADTVEHTLLLGDASADSAPLGVLSQTQEALLWEQVIQHSLRHQDTGALFNTSGLASAAMEANRYLIEWDLSVDVAQATEETKQFLVWRQRFQTLCKQAGYLESVRYQRWQLQVLAQSTLDVARLIGTHHIQLAGFDRINPHLQQLIDLLTVKGVQVTMQTMANPANRVAQTTCTEQLDECRAAVAWAQTKLAQNPQAKLAIVVPELDSLRATIKNLLDDTFHPATLHPAHAEAPRMYEFSLGLALSEYPLVQTALQLLDVAFSKHSIAQTTLSALLHDVYWSHSMSEADVRAQLDAKMRSTLPMQLRFKSFVDWLTRMQEGERAIVCPKLLADAQALLQGSESAPKQQSASAWARAFAQCLSACHWLGGRTPSSVEYQTAERFKRTLAEMASLDPWLAQISASEALRRLTQLCQAQIFQAQTTVSPNIVVMGMLEASAEPLDGVWVMGMNDHIWPPLARTNALIPAELQRSAGTPNASSEVQTAFAMSIHQRLLHSANELIFSYADKDGDRLLRASPLLQGIPTLTTITTQANTLAEQLAIANQQDWQWLDDAQAPPVLEGEHVAGGTGLLHAQAICPAWAFYQYRLNARKLDEPQTGLDAMTRGQLIHALLAAFWQQPDAAQTLHTPNALKQTLDSLANTVMAAFNQAHQEHYSSVFLMLEAERLSKLALTWLLEVDAQRPTPFKVLACEQEYKTLIEGIQIKLIIDRIDQLEDGRLVVIDYKTSSVLDYKNWAEARITEPQLPIYAAFILKDQDVAAVCFGRVRTSSSGFVGIAAAQDLVQGLEVFDNEKRRTFEAERFNSWQAILTHWHSSITAVAQSIKAGQAAVLVEDERDLAYCDVLPLLRLPERQLQFERWQQTEGV